jgi:kinetochore protein Spc24
MLLDEDPATVCLTSAFSFPKYEGLELTRVFLIIQLIHHTIGNFNIHPDKLAVTRINESLATMQHSRELRMREAESALRKLSRNLKALETRNEETVASHDPAKHAAQIIELDTQKFRIAKAASELEIESERLEGELEMLKERLAELEAQGLEGDETVRREREADDATMYVVPFSPYFSSLVLLR